MSYTFTTSAAILRKAGLNVNSTAAASNAMIANFSDQAEGKIVLETRRDFISSYSSLNQGVKWALDDCTSSLAAIMLINYDMSGYTSRTEAQTMLDVLSDNATRTLAVLKDFKSAEIRSV